MISNEWLETVDKVSDVCLFMSVIFQLVLLGYLIFQDEKKGLFYELVEWPSDVKQRCIYVYAYLSMAVMLVTSSLIFSCHSDTMRAFMAAHPILCSICINVGLFSSMLFLHSLDFEGRYKPKIFFFVMHSILAAPSICELGAEVCLNSLWYMVQVLIVGTGLALLAHKDFHKRLMGPLSRFNSVVLAASICSSVLGNPVKNWLEVTLFCINVHVGLPFFIWMYTLNTQMLLCHAKEECQQFDPVYIASVMLINLLNIYVRMTTLTAISMSLKQFNELKSR